MIERELEQMTEQIKSIIQAVNANQVAAPVLLCCYIYKKLFFLSGLTVLFCFNKTGELEATDGMNPLDVVVRILNNQLSSLMWIDEKVRYLLFSLIIATALCLLVSFSDYNHSFLIDSLKY